MYDYVYTYANDWYTWHWCIAQKHLTYYYPAVNIGFPLCMHVCMVCKKDIHVDACIGVALTSVIVAGYDSTKKASFSAKKHKKIK